MEEIQAGLVKNTTGLLISAGKKYWFLKRQL